MSLADALATERDAQDKRGPKCAVCLVLDRLSPSEEEALTRALADETYTGAAIARALKGEGHGTIMPATINRHRRGECRRHRES